MTSKPMSVGDLAEVVVDEFSSQCAERQVSIVYEPPGEDTMTMLDLERFKQVIRNLLSNAVKFSPPQGTVQVQCTGSPHPLDQRSRRRTGNSARGTRTGVRQVRPIEQDEVRKWRHRPRVGDLPRDRRSASGASMGGEQRRAGCTFYCELPLVQPEISDDDDSQEVLSTYLHDFS